MQGSLERELRAALQIARRLACGRRVFVLVRADGRVIFLSLALMALLAVGCGAPGNYAAAPSSAPTRPQATATPDLTANIEVLDWRFEDDGYGSIYAIGELRNNNRAAVGPKLLITAYDGAGRVLDSIDCWPASVDNVPAGATWPINCPLTTKPGIERATLRVVSVHQWP